MDQLAREDLVLYLTGAYLSAPEKAEIEQKLNQSPQFVPELEKLKQQIDQFLQENQTEWGLIFAHLEDYLDGKITAVSGVDFQQLLDEHPDCKRIYQVLQKELTFEEAEKLKHPMSEQLAHRFDYLLKDSLEASQREEPSASLSKKINTLLERIALVLAPISEPAFLGESVKGEAEIRIAGGTISVEMGVPGRIVKILSHDGEELEVQTSDENGVVTFRDFEPDAYLIKVEGFKIQEIQRMTK